MSDLTTPDRIMDRLREIEEDLSVRQNALESAARKWFILKREREKDRAVAFMRAAGTVAERNAQADMECALTGHEEEAEWEALRSVVRVLDTRASIGQSLLKAMGRS